jgi:hypothetical protein
VSRAPAKDLYATAIVSYALLLAGGGAMVYAFGALNEAANTPYNSLAPSPAPDLTLPWTAYRSGMVASFIGVVAALALRSQARQLGREELRGLALLALVIGILELVALACGGAWLNFAIGFCSRGC